MKFCLLILIVTSIVAMRCSNADEDLNKFNKQAVTGFWKLEKIKENGVQIPFSQFRTPISEAGSGGLRNMYYHFDQNQKFKTTYEHNTVRFVRGDWLVKKDTLTLMSRSTRTINYKLVSFNQTQLVLIDPSVPELELTFSRITQENYPETSLSALINNELFFTDFNYAINDNHLSLSLLGDNNNELIVMGFLFNPQNLKVGEKYSIDGSTVLAKYGRFGSIENETVGGSISIKKLSSNYIQATFEFKSRDPSGIEFMVTKGDFKAIIIKQ